jgi:serine/threonine protein kinase
VVMDICSAGELYEMVGRLGTLDENLACDLFHQMINAIDYCHQNSIIHRDLKLENVLLDPTADQRSYHLRLIDFGLGTLAAPNALLSTSCGSPHYASPDLINGKEYLAAPIDMWNLGVILFAMLCGHLPFVHADTNTLYDLICDLDYRFSGTVSDSAKDLVQNLLTGSQHDRYTVQQVRRHPWYQRVSHATDPDQLDATRLALPVLENELDPCVRPTHYVFPFAS